MARNEYRDFRLVSLPNLASPLDREPGVGRLRDPWLQVILAPFAATQDNVMLRSLLPRFPPLLQVNSNGYDLGMIEDSKPVGDVELPPWAKGDPYKFIRIHREALESDYVSAHLHHWIGTPLLGYLYFPAHLRSLSLLARLGYP